MSDPTTSSTEFQPFQSPYPTYFRSSNYYNDSTPLTDGPSLLSDSFMYETGFVGLINQAMTCYLNSLLQTLYMTPEFRNAIYRWQYKPSQLCIINNEQLAGSKKNIPYQLQKLFVQMQTSNKKCLHTQDLTQSFGWGSDDAFQQHDVQELCRVMFDALEKMFKGTEQENLITELYQGKIKDYVKCTECNTESARVDVFLDIQLSIKSYIDEYNYNLYDSIEKAMSAYIEPEILDDTNKYFCEKCQKLCKAHKGIIFETFPYILCLQLKRFDFDYKTMMRIKLNNKVTFPQVLDIKPYLSPSTLDANPDTVTEYELFSIMIHSGSATGGHYYAYIHDFLTDQWLNFNDERVNRLDAQDIKKAYGVSYSSFSSTTAYMLLYRQKDPKRNEIFINKEQFPMHIIELLKREQEELEEAEKLKEYLDNLCKIKVILVNTDQMDMFKPNESKYIEKQCNLHKDLTLQQAKFELAKEFSLLKHDEDYIKTHTRLVKYDLYNEHIEQSFDNELITVYESLNHLKQIYGYCWLFEVNNNDNVEFNYYKPGSISIKFIEMNANLYETNDMFSLRVDNEITTMELLMLVNARLKIVEDNDEKFYDEIIDRISLALERQHTFSPYVYLNEHLNKSLNCLGFLKSNKVFIDYRRSGDSEEMKFNKNKFFHILQTISNLIQLTCFLPTNEQCIIYKNKLVRRYNLTDKKKSMKFDRYSNNENNLDTYDEVMIARGSTTNEAASTDDFIDMNVTAAAPVGFNKRRNAYAAPATFEEDEDELDFGNSTNKVIKQKQERVDVETTNSNGVLKRRFSDELSKSVDNIQLKTTKRSDGQDEMSISSPPPSDLKDIEVDIAQPILHQQHYRYHHHNVIDMETSLDEGIGSGSSPNHIKNSPNSLDNLRGSPDTNLNEIDDVDSAVTSTTTTTKFEGNLVSTIFDHNAAGVDIVGDGDDESDAVDNLSTNNDHYGPYSQTYANDNDMMQNQVGQFEDPNEDWDRDCELESLNKKIHYNNNNNNNATMMSTS